MRTAAVVGGDWSERKLVGSEGWKEQYSGCRAGHGWGGRRGGGGRRW